MTPTNGPIPSSPPSPAPAARPFGLLAQFADAEALLAAARAVRDAGYRRWDCYSPFPVHGLDQAMGRRPTLLPWLVLLAGLAGLGAGLHLVWHTNAQAGPSWAPASLQGYPYLISGKPFFSLPANIPVLFELTILLAALAATFGMLALNGLPSLYHPLLRSPRFRRVTTDGLFLAVEARDPRFHPEATRRLLEALGAVAVEMVDD